MLTLHLLGTPQILLTNEPLLLRSAKAQALLVYLALTGRTHSRPALAGLLWPEKSDAEARTNLRQALYALRHALPNLLVSSRESIGLQPEAIKAIDTAHFEEQAQFGLAGDVDALQQAADLYRGEFLAGFYVEDAITFEEWVLLTRERLHKVAFQTLQQLTTYYVSEQDSIRGLRYAEQLLTLEPWREETHYQLMQLLAWNGQPQSALAQFNRCRHLLANELGTTPSAKMVALAEAIRQGTIAPVERPIRYRSSTVAAIPPPPSPAPIAPAAEILKHQNVLPLTDLRSQRTIHPYTNRKPAPALSIQPPHNLPTYPSNFVGRREELTALRQKILSTAVDTPDHTTYRLVTLVGPGGVGKTRLALQLATELLPDFGDGIWFVDLVAMTDPDLIIHAVASVLGVQERTEHPLLATVCHALAEKALLLLVDNCEHLLQGCVTVVEQLLAAVPTLQIIATSREPLHRPYELRFHVKPLPLPFPSSSFDPTTLLMFEGIRLFVDRATAISHEFALTEENGPDVVAICQLLDGLPLAMELVAARTRILTVRQIAEQLRAEPTAQLHLAAQRRSHGPPRHRTLRSLIEWSYQLLPTGEQQLLQRLAVFVGSCAFTAIEQVCIDEQNGQKNGKVTLAHSATSIARYDILDLLEGLVDKSLVVAEPVGARMRYRLLESIRQFALEKLMAAGEEEWLRDRHLAFYVDYAEKMGSQRTSLPRAEWQAQMQAEIDNIRGALAWALVSTAVVPGLRITTSIGEFWFSRGFHRESVRWSEQLLTLTDEETPSTLRLAALSDVEFTYWWIFEDYARAQQLQQEALQLAQRLGDQHEIEKMLNNLGGVALRTQNYAMAKAHLQQSLALSAESGNQLNHAWSHILLGEVAMAEGDDMQAVAYFQEAVERLQPIQARNLLAYPLRRLGYLAQQRHNYANALAHYRESLQLNAEVGEPEGKCACFVSYVQLLAELGEQPLAIQLCAVLDAQLHADQIRLPFFERNYYTETVTRLRAQVDKATFATAWEAGHKFTLTDAVKAALSWGIDEK